MSTTATHQVEAAEKVPRVRRLRRQCADIAPSPKFSNLVADLPCRWGDCSDTCPNLYAYYTHLRRHMWNGTDISNVRMENCRWTNCLATQPWTPTHLYYHGYHEKLKLLGSRKLVSRQGYKCHLSSQSLNTVDVFDAFECEWADCDYVIDNPEDFNFHLIIHVHETIERTNWRTDIYECQWTDCQLDFTYSLLRGHVKSHSSQKDSACPTCGAIFRSANKFLDHFRRQMQPENPEEALQCRYCSKAFKHERILRDHERQHISQYKCPFCEMTMPAPNDLRGHIATRHTTERPFACSLCASRFKLPRNLSTHMDRVHKITEMRCKHSNCTFTTRSHYKMRRHRLQGHNEGEARVYACHLCSARFEIEGHLLSRHLVAEHGLQWPAGHRRFFYVREPSEGVFRLQTFRYESADISEIVPEGVGIDKAGAAALRARTRHSEGVEDSSDVEEVDDLDPEEEELEEQPVEDEDERGGDDVGDDVDDDDEGDHVEEQGAVAAQQDDARNVEEHAENIDEEREDDDDDDERKMVVDEETDQCQEEQDHRIAC